ncbi:MAG: hypothetical protein M4579_007282 [Chaenotheca gracillima]|nr:MAG: hypothetical protein M4579_007282 [Chaenotheca gracillima]
MIDGNNPQTIFTLRAEEPNAIKAFNLINNAHRLVPSYNESVHSYEEGNDASSREATPYIPRPRLPELCVDFLSKPKNPTEGFAFGSEKRFCDIVLDENNSHGISRLHFYVNFNWNSQILMITNASRSGTAIRTTDGPIVLKDREKRMLSPEEDNVISVGDVRISLSIPDHSKHQCEYEGNLKAFQTECQRSAPELGHLGLRSPPSTGHVKRLRGFLAAYYFCGQIGRGSFGTVHKVAERATGEYYAAKQMPTRHGSSHFARREVRLLQKSSHDHIVKFFDVIEEEEEVILIMEYLPLGNLVEQLPISEKETKTFLYQACQALAYLHHQNIIHRDLKPENILVQYRAPHLFIKLSDFGLANQAAHFNTHCGSPYYVAPEVYNSFYTHAVDMWSLGVIGCECLIGLPRKPVFKDSGAWSRAWATAILQRLGRKGRGPIIETVRKMLDQNEGDRISAKECLMELCDSPSPVPKIQSMTPIFSTIGKSDSDDRPSSQERAQKRPRPSDSKPKGIQSILIEAMIKQKAKKQEIHTRPQDPVSYLTNQEPLDDNEPREETASPSPKTEPASYCLPDQHEPHDDHEIHAREASRKDDAEE